MGEGGRVTASSEMSERAERATVVRREEACEDGAREIGSVLAWKWRSEPL